MGMFYLFRKGMIIIIEKSPYHKIKHTYNLLRISNTYAYKCLANLHIYQELLKKTYDYQNQIEPAKSRVWTKEAMERNIFGPCKIFSSTYQIMSLGRAFLLVFTHVTTTV